MERDSMVQKLKHQIFNAVKEGHEKKAEKLKQQLADRLEYLNRHGLANNPKMKPRR